MAYSNINKPTDYFNTVLYSGTGAAQSITGVGFQPQILWQKSRSAAQNHRLMDIVRGNNLTLKPDTTLAEVANSTTLDSDGFSFTDGSGENANDSGKTYVAWNWLAGGTGVSNTDGTITSTVSANTTSGFSIVSYTGTGSVATVGHGLGVAPNIVIVKQRTVAGNHWIMYHSALPSANYFLYLCDTDPQQTATGFFNNTAPTSSVFTIGTDAQTNGNTNSLIAYCFAEKKGFSKFGSYTGNGSTDGTFIYTGFKPAWVMTKKITDRTSANWLIQTADGLNPYNPVNQQSLRANLSNAALNAYDMDFLSNGIKMYNDSSNANEASKEFIYMAFAENPLVGTNNIPATAR